MLNDATCIGLGQIKVLSTYKLGAATPTFYVPGPRMGSKMERNG